MGVFTSEQSRYSCLKLPAEKMANDLPADYVRLEQDEGRVEDGSIRRGKGNYLQDHMGCVLEKD